MEPHKDLVGIERFRPSLDEGPQEYFNKALQFAREFYSEQMDQIASVRFEEVTPEHFFAEYVSLEFAHG